MYDKKLNVHYELRYVQRARHVPCACAVCRVPRVRVRCVPCVTRGVLSNLC